MCRDPKLLADAMKSYRGIEGLNTRDCIFKGLFVFMKGNFDLPPCANCDLHQPNKVNYSIPHPNTWVKMACIEKSLNSTEHGVAHTTSTLIIDFFTSQWHIIQLPPNFAKKVG